MRHLILGILICVASALAVRAASPPGNAALAQGAVVVGIDVDTAGNAATSLGEPQFCRSVDPGNSFDADVFLHEIPGGRNLAGFSYILRFDGQLASVQAKDHGLLLVAGRDASGVADLSDEVPDADGEYKVEVADLSPTGAQPGPLSGVLARYTIQVASTAPTGRFSLALELLTLADSDANEIPISEIQSGTIAVGQPCAAADQTPVVVRPTPEPTAQPTASGTLSATQSPKTTTPGPGGTTSASRTPAGELPGSTDDGDGFPWIAALVSVLIGLAVLGGGGLLIWRRWPGRPPGTGL